jgi:DNA-3-methyladenine glycosylase
MGTSVKTFAGISSGASRLRRGFFAAAPDVLARRLLGQRLVRTREDGTRLSGIIVEVEAYLGVEDRAAHSYGGRRTARTEAMYGPPGTAYVYFTYGMHCCFNVVCGRVDEPVAVLIRALEPVEGIEAMRALRGAGARGRDSGLCSGPARLCQALQIDLNLNRIDLVSDSRLCLERARSRPVPASGLVNTPRIGVGYAGPWAGRLLRWHIRGNPHVSRSR